MRILAHAKINWTLEITGVDANGYHLLDMLMQSIDLADEIILTPADQLSLAVEGSSSIPNDGHNLALRAAIALQERTGVRCGAAIHLVKHIPSGAGLGGGSADAAAVLYGLNQLWQTGLGQTELERIGLSLGADVPFCLRGGLCRAEGIGEKLTSYQNPPVWPLVIVKPCEGLSTAEIYRGYTSDFAVRPAHEAVLHAAEADDPSLLPPHPGNALENVSESFLPSIRQCRNALRSLGAVCAQMSGSGSAVFGVFADEACAADAAKALSTQWPFVVQCRTSGSPFTFMDQGADAS